MTSLPYNSEYLLSQKIIGCQLTSPDEIGTEREAPNTIIDYQNNNTRVAAMLKYFCVDARVIEMLRYFGVDNSDFPWFLTKVMVKLVTLTLIQHLLHLQVLFKVPI